MPSRNEKERNGVLASRTDAGAYAAAIRSALQLSPQQFDDGLAAAIEDFDLVAIVRRFFHDVSGEMR